MLCRFIAVFNWISNGESYCGARNVDRAEPLRKTSLDQYYTVAAAAATGAASPTPCRRVVHRWRRKSAAMVDGEGRVDFCFFETVRERTHWSPSDVLLGSVFCVEIVESVKKKKKTNRLVAIKVCEPSKFIKWTLLLFSLAAFLSLSLKQKEKHDVYAYWKTVK